MLLRHTPKSHMKGGWSRHSFSCYNKEDHTKAAYESILGARSLASPLMSIVCIPLLKWKPPGYVRLLVVEVASPTCLDYGFSYWSIVTGGMAGSFVTRQERTHPVPESKATSVQ